MEENAESQLYLLEFLADFKDPRNQRQRLKTSHFKTLNAIYLFTRHNEKKGRQFHYPSKELLSDMAKIDRSLVTEFITSDEIGIFCEVERQKFISNRYKLKEWVYEWFRLFYRSGMMKGMHENYDRWLADFKKRLSRWLLPLVQLGHSIRDIYERFLNKLSTPKSLKVAAANPLKVAAIHASGGSMKPSGNQDIEASPLTSIPCFKEFQKNLHEMIYTFKVRESDANRICTNFSPSVIKKGISERRLWKKRGFIAKSPVMSMIGAIKKAMGIKNV